MVVVLGGCNSATPPHSVTENFFFSTGVEDDEASLSVSADKESPV